MSGSPLRIGLTGGIASGKSLVARFFAEQGAEVIDTDEIARELVLPGTPALEKIVASFGPGVLTHARSLDRARLRSIVFSDPERRRVLESILHPLIRAETLARADRSSAPYAVLVVPLLFETGFDRLVHRKLVVDCPESVQLTRLIERDGIGETEARAMLAAQLGRDERLAGSDDRIDNSGSPESTRKQVLDLHARYLILAKNCPRLPGRAE